MFVIIMNNNLEKSIDWYSRNKFLYELLSKKVEAIIKEVLESKKIDYSNIEFRAKGIESFKNKLKKGVSYNPKEMQDLAGIRIIGYVNSDVNKVVETIKDLFDIDKKRSIDKSKILGIDKVGYRSVHFVAKLSEERLKLPEFKKFEGMYFEIQIRTILQHAWAEIEHDRNYKFSGVLPEEIKRRFSLLAGVLELADNEFENISNLIENYSKEVSEKTKSGELDIPIDSTSLRQYLSEKFGDIPNIENSFGYEDQSTELIHELNDMELYTLKDLDSIIPSNYTEILTKYKGETNFSTIIRDLLIITNKEKYFKEAWKNHWMFLDRDALEIYEKLGVNPDELMELFKDYDIHLV